MGKLGEGEKREFMTFAFLETEDRRLRLSRTTTMVSQEEQNGDRKEKGNEEENHKIPGKEK
jgi:hypothetical protein